LASPAAVDTDSDDVPGVWTAPAATAADGDGMAFGTDVDESSETVSL
jgi:hypothetical protein